MGIDGTDSLAEQFFSVLEETGGEVRDRITQLEARLKALNWRRHPLHTFLELLCEHVALTFQLYHQDGQGTVEQMLGETCVAVGTHAFWLKNMSGVRTTASRCLRDRSTGVVLVDEADMLSLSQLVGVLSSGTEMIAAWDPGQQLQPLDMRHRVAPGERWHADSDAREPSAIQLLQDLAGLNKASHVVRLLETRRFGDVVCRLLSQISLAYSGLHSHRDAPDTTLVLWRVSGHGDSGFEAFRNASGAVANVTFFCMCANLVKRLSRNHGCVLVVVWYAVLRQALNHFLRFAGVDPAHFSIRTARQAKGEECAACVVLACRRFSWPDFAGSLSDAGKLAVAVSRGRVETHILLDAACQWANVSMWENMWRFPATSVVDLTPEDENEEEIDLFRFWMTATWGDECSCSDSEEAADDDQASTCASFFASASAVSRHLPDQLPDRQIRSSQPPMYAVPEDTDLREIWPRWRAFLVPCITVVAGYKDKEPETNADGAEADVEALLSLKFLEWHTVPDHQLTAPGALLFQVKGQLRDEAAFWELRISRHKAETQTVAGVNFFSQRCRSWRPEWQLCSEGKVRALAYWGMGTRGQHPWLWSMVVTVKSLELARAVLRVADVPLTKILG
ncbi:unnamed protein product [Symbiodinium natans]|uniref:Uncharacterized protein n=1 Tax=Symbiodinium natans TaxID=878477 RepID=A0A812HDY7_9DINO|nr:unnamed protein product [Symbiodinium natans]